MHIDEIELKITPVPKPRQTQKDRWGKRPCVVRYREFCDEVRAQLNGLILPECYEVEFYLPVMPSYPKKKKAELIGKPHREKPDLDNLVKALQDAVFSKHNPHATSDDSHIWRVVASKFWAREGAGRIYIRRI